MSQDHASTSHAGGCAGEDRPEKAGGVSHGEGQTQQAGYPGAPYPGAAPHGAPAGHPPYHDP